MTAETTEVGEDPTPIPPKGITPETEQRFTGPRRKLKGASPDLAGSKRLPKLTTSSPLLLITGERHTRSRDLIQKQDHRIASIEQIEISSITSSHQLRNQAESPVKKPEKLKKQSRHRTRRSYDAGKEPARRMLKESPSPRNKAGETCLKMHGFPEAKPKER
ncbi:hypothetical protein DY000_02023787 [Brassica cretica]|uniref:Shugoshin C-terminal domain-containing protein n=1 Tax=Brassica cretica TaxID=69181 RepID=A0ABQ7E2D2_BRACR|nr:hypothetical protein DY000_02023787 [Brassica cretica]